MCRADGHPRQIESGQATERIWAELRDLTCQDGAYYCRLYCVCAVPCPCYAKCESHTCSIQPHDKDVKESKDQNDQV